MALVSISISKIPCNQTNLHFKYELDTNLFNENIFKMCTECGVFVHDFSVMFCTCGRKVEYVDVSGADAMKWFNLLSKDSELLTDDHVCDIGEDCSNPDCIDCQESTWEKDSDTDTNPDYFQEYVNDPIACGPDCGPNCDCGGDYVDFDGADSVS